MEIASALDPQGYRVVTENIWVLGLITKARNPEHAFIVVEGYREGQVFYRRYDLTKQDLDAENYEIEILPEVTCLPKDCVTTLCNDVLRVENVQENINGKCWDIAPKKANELDVIMKQERDNPGQYNICGNNASLPKTGEISKAVSPNITEGVTGSGIRSAAMFGNTSEIYTKEALRNSGHNCFTKARDCIKALGIPEINCDLPIKREEIFASVTSRHLGNAEAKSGCTIL